MSKWRTIYHPGAAYFVTSTVVDFIPIFMRKRYIDILLQNLNFYRVKYRFKLYAYVIMPEHIHLIIHPSSNTKIASIMRDFKSFTSKKITSQLIIDKRFKILKRLKRSATKKVKHPIWKEGCRPIGIYTEKVLRSKIDYIHKNPIRRGLVKNLEKYLYSSYRNYYLDDDSLIKIDKDWL